MKEEWHKYKLHDLCEITSSKRFHLSERTTSGIPFYCTKEILLKLKGERDFECDYIGEKFYEEIKQKFGVPEKDDVLITSRGTIGFPYLYKEDDKFYFADGNLSWFRNFKKELNSHFLYYWFLSPFGKSKVEAIAKGAAQKALPIAGLEELEIEVPSILTQRKIASIMISYDKLIDNNRKQIRLLEEAAQKLYKEWFVKLNFPEHENIKIVDGIPEGWRLGKVGEIGNFKRGKVITKAQTESGTIPVIAGGIEPAYYHNTSNTQCPVITVSASGNAGFVKMYYCNVWASDCSYLDSNSTDNLYFVYTVLKSKQEYLYSLQKGACQKHVNATEINNLEILIPTQDLITRFNELSRTFFEDIKILQNQNKDLISSRDKLLPKLMNQEIEVTA